MNDKQSRAGWIREHLQELEDRLEVGVRRAVIVAELQALGYSCSVHELSNDLSRARRWARSKAEKATAAAPGSTGGVTAVALPTPEPKVVAPKPSLSDKLKKPAGMEFKGTPSKSDEENLF
jgi:hypothetical protein